MNRSLPGAPGHCLFISVVIMAASLLISPDLFAGSYDLDLIEADQLSRESSRWVVLDGRPRSVWEKGHLPGAYSFSWEEHTRTDPEGIPYRVSSPEELAESFGRLGVDEKTPVVVYGDADSSWGGEGWIAWVLTWIGHQGPIRLLNGGVQSWEGAEHPLVRERPGNVRATVSYRVQLRSEVSISADQLQQRSAEFSLVDVRSGWERFRSGVPGAVHISWKDLLVGKERKLLPAAAYRDLLTGQEVRADRPIVFYCTGGIRSGFAWLADQLLRGGRSRNFEGGTEAWERR